MKVRRLVGPAAVKCHLGRWTATHEEDYPPWESIKKAPLWESEEWGSFRSILARPVVEPEVETTDEAVHTLHVEGQISRDGEPIEGPQVMFVQMVRRALPAAFTNRRFSVVWLWCLISIVCEINEPWLILRPDCARAVLEKTLSCAADLR